MALSAYWIYHDCILFELAQQFYYDNQIERYYRLEMYNNCPRYYYDIEDNIISYGV